MTTRTLVRGNPTLDRVLRYVEKIVPLLSPLLAVVALIYIYNYGTDTLSVRQNRADLKLYTFALMWIALTSSWNLIGGYAGYVDFGHTLFVGIGSYTVANMMWSGAYDNLALNYSLNFWQSLPVAFVVGALFAGAFGWPTLRLKGPYFAIAMLGLLVAVQQMSNTLPDLTNGGEGIAFRRPFAEPLDVFYTMLGLVAVTFFLSLWIYRSQLGKMLQAIREDEVGADMRGINTTAVKIGIFMLAGGFTASVGATRAWWQTYVDPVVVYPEDYTIQIIMMVMLGGIGRPWGPVIGASVFYYAQTTFWAELGNLNLLVTGLFLIVLTLFVPGGILGFFDPEDRGLTWHIHRLRLYLLGEAPSDETIRPDREPPEAAAEQRERIVRSVIPEPVLNFMRKYRFERVTRVITRPLFAVFTAAGQFKRIVRSMILEPVLKFTHKYHFEMAVSVFAYPLFALAIGAVWFNWQSDLQQVLPDVLFGLSMGELLAAGLIVYLIYLNIRTTIDIGNYVSTETRVEADEILLSGKHVIKDFGGLRAVNQVDFEVRAGEIVGLLGPNGSGKTTLFNCISGVLPITDGQIFLRDQEISRKAPWRINRHGLSRTFQKIRIFDNLTVFDNMLLSRKWDGVPTFLWLYIAPPYIRHEAEELLDFLLLQRVRNNLARNLSGGQQRLLEIGMSLMSNPDIVLLDEATSGVNPALIEEIKTAIVRLNEERGVTFFLIEHNMNFIMDLCGRLYVLDYGTKIAEGGPADIQSNPDVIEAYFGRDE